MVATKCDMDLSSFFCEDKVVVPKLSVLSVPNYWCNELSSDFQFGLPGDMCPKDPFVCVLRFREKNPE